MPRRPFRGSCPGSAARAARYRAPYLPRSLTAGSQSPAAGIAINRVTAASAVRRAPSRPAPIPPGVARDGSRPLPPVVCACRRTRPASRAASPRRTEAAGHAVRVCHPGAAPFPLAAPRSPGGWLQTRETCLPPVLHARLAARHPRSRSRPARVKCAALCCPALQKCRPRAPALHLTGSSPPTPAHPVAAPARPPR